jgi:tRNA (guanine37-N1)-methyltransferase
MRFDIITIFPHIFDSYFDQSMVKRAQLKKLVDIRVHDLREFTKDKHKKVDERPYGGGPGMVLQAEPILRAIESLVKPSISKSKFLISKQSPNSKSQTLIVLFSASGKQFDSNMAGNFAKKYEHIIFIAGRYEGIDARIVTAIRNSKFEIRNLSIGPYVLTGGEIPAMVVVDAVSRHIKGVLGKHESLEEKRHGIGVPMYTRPETFVWPPPGWGKKGKKYKVPKILLSGDHKKVEEWRKKNRYG